MIFWAFLFLLWPSFLFLGGFFNKTIILLALVGYEMCSKITNNKVMIVRNIVASGRLDQDTVRGVVGNEGRAVMKVATLTCGMKASSSRIT